MYTHFTCFNTKNVLANSNFKSFNILVHNNQRGYNNEHIMTLKYDKLKFYWAAVTEKNIKIVSLERDRPFPFKF